jgi:hypothetical protein
MDARPYFGVPKASQARRELEARANEGRRLLSARLEEREAISRAWRERRERRRERLRWPTFGLLGRSRPLGRIPRTGVQA